MDVQFVNGVDGLPVRSGSTAQWIDAEFQAGGADSLRVHHIPEVFDVGKDEIFLVSGRGAQRGCVRYAFNNGFSTSEQFVRPVLDPSRRARVGRAAIRRVVLEASVLWRIMRRCDHNVIGEVIFAAAIVDQDGARDDWGRGNSILPLYD